MDVERKFKVLSVTVTFNEADLAELDGIKSNHGAWMWLQAFRSDLRATRNADSDPQPQPSDGPDYHADLAAWETRQEIR